MLKNDLILRNPLRLMGNGADRLFPDGGFGAVLARAGVGKTALMVQLALESLLNERNVLHIGLDDPVEKVKLWYKEVFFNLSPGNPPSQMQQLWENILPHRFIMTFRVEGFSVPKLEERLRDLSEQHIFVPEVIIFDGFPFEEDKEASLAQLKAFSKHHRLCVWFSVRTHRHENTAPNGLPPQLAGVEHLFEAVIALQPDGEKIHIKALRGPGASAAGPALRLDPATMLIVDD